MGLVKDYIKDNKMKNFFIVGAIIAIIAGILLFPLATIWALNTLFGLGIAYTWKTWLAVIVINFTLASVGTANRANSK